jgi:hypothetical protein
MEDEDEAKSQSWRFSVDDKIRIFLHLMCQDWNWVLDVKTFGDIPAFIGQCACLWQADGDLPGAFVRVHSLYERDVTAHRDPDQAFVDTCRRHPDQVDRFKDRSLLRSLFDAWLTGQPWFLPDLFEWRLFVEATGPWIQSALRFVERYHKSADEKTMTTTTTAGNALKPTVFSDQRYGNVAELQQHLSHKCQFVQWARLQTFLNQTSHTRDLHIYYAQGASADLSALVESASSLALGPLHWGATH